ncbi:putative nucleoside transporter [Trichodelitschia bisporula]|uniref:Putative nucleoside transporter n=1 Tax=Trichodelitschia bisporula TaxID=703511 RepID=A0A6G1I8F4_9PEZI|nr:putative nucleoside transporter [Trichodelitschia bisporula]
MDVDAEKRGYVPKPLETGAELAPSPSSHSSACQPTVIDLSSAPRPATSLATRLWNSIITTNFESRGIARVPETARHPATAHTLGRTFRLWFGINLAANNITLGILGPATFGLSFRDAALTAALGVLPGCAAVAYTASFGPRSGLRTVVAARFIMGWWPARLVVILNGVVMLGYALIDCVVGGQMLAAVAPGLSVVVGIIIIALLTAAITTLGFAPFARFETHAWIPQLFVFAVLAGSAGPRFDLSAPSIGDARTVRANRASFFSICLAAAITYAGVGADYFVYAPARTPRWRTALPTFAGLALSFAFALLLGVGLGSGVASDPGWTAAHDHGPGALLVEGFSPLGDFGRACAIIAALGLVANTVAPTYSAGIGWQMLGGPLARVPRVVFNGIGIVVYTVCALAGRGRLAEIFENFLALMGYFVVILIAIWIWEHGLFRRRRGWRWEDWSDKAALPAGWAAGTAFLVGWVGAVLGMSQVWFVGPISKLAAGADLGNYLGFSWAALVFPPLRWLELKYLGR